MEALKEALKELLRVVLLAVVPVIIVSLENGGEINPKAVAVVALLAALRFVDKFLHEYGKDNDSKTLEGGLTRF